MEEKKQLIFLPVELNPNFSTLFCVVFFFFLSVLLNLLCVLVFYLNAGSQLCNRLTSFLVD